MKTDKLKPLHVFKLYKVEFNYHKEDKVNPTLSSGGCMYYLVSSKEAEKIASKPFIKEYSEYFDEFSTEISIIKLPKFVTLTNSGILNLR